MPMQMDIAALEQQPVLNGATMNGDFDFSEITTTELEQIIGTSAMEDLTGMMHRPAPNAGTMYNGMPPVDSGTSSRMLMNGSAIQHMPLPPPPVMQQLLTSPQPPHATQVNPPAPADPLPSSQSQMAPKEPWVEITEQPRQRGLRFRYQCEGRSAGSIPGESSTNENKTFPTIKIHNYRGQAIIVVSCVTKESPPRCKPHPHSLVGKDCKKGVCTVKVKDASIISFPQLGIQCAKKKDVEEALKLRKDINVDPYQTGFDHAVSNIDLNMVRLCFQVFLPDSNGKVTRVVPPVVSEPIQDKKAQNDLVICRVDKTSGQARGGDEVFLLCEKVCKDDIKVRFFEEGGEETAWEAFGDFGQGDVHKQVAIVFKTPRYKEELITRPMTVNMQLFRPSNNQGSEPIKFTYMPEDPDPDRIEEKRKRKGDWLKTMPSSESSDGPSSSSSSVKESLRHMLKAHRRIKQEQQESTQATGTHGMSMSSQGSGSSLEPLSSTPSLPQSHRPSDNPAVHPHHASVASPGQPRYAATSSADASHMVQQFIQQQQQLQQQQQQMVAGGSQAACGGGQMPPMSITSTASGSSQLGSLDDSLLNLVTRPTSTLISNFDLNTLQSFMDQGASFSSGDGGSSNMVELPVSQDMYAGAGSLAGEVNQQFQQSPDFYLEVQAAIESLNQQS